MVNLILTHKPKAILPSARGQETHRFQTFLKMILSPPFDYFFLFEEMRCFLVPGPFSPADHIASR